MVAIVERIIQLSSKNSKLSLASDAVITALAELYNLRTEDVTPEKMKQIQEEAFHSSVAESGLKPVTEEELRQAAADLRKSLGI
jgi:hypothetical protein